MVAKYQATSSPTTVTIDQKRPEFSAEASPNFTVFWRVMLLSARPSQIISAEGDGASGDGASGTGRAGAGPSGGGAGGGAAGSRSAGIIRAPRP